MRTKGNQLSSIDTTKSILSSSSPPINDDNDDDENDSDSDDETLPTIVPLNSSWLNGTNDSDSSTSPLSYSTTNLSSIDEQKPQSNPISSSSKKRKSVPQKIITTKKLHIDLTTENSNSNSKNKKKQRMYFSIWNS